MTEQELKEMREAMENEGKGQSKTWRPSKDKTSIRFLPPMKKNGEKIPYLHHKMHWVNGMPYECLNQSLEDSDGNFHEAESCPFCRTGTKLWQGGEQGSEEQELAKKLFASDRYVFRILVRGKEDETDPEFYEVGPQIYKKFKSVILDGEYGNIVHPIEGRDFVIKKEGSGRQTKYENSAPAANVSQMFESKDDIKKTLQKATEMNFNTLIKFKSADELKQAVKDFLDPTASSNSSSQKEDIKPSKSLKEESSESVSATDNDVEDMLSEFF